jgi:DNA-binding beta-propeller fold protein YncE
MITKTLAILFVALLFSSAASGQEAYTRIPAKFLFALGGEGTALNLEQPLKVRPDRRRQEFYLTDTGHNRIIILNSQGNYLFDFADREKLQAPCDLGVDIQGRIYVLCTPVEGHPLQVFDYNGDYLNSFAFHGGPSLDSVSFNSFVIDDQEQMFLADEKGGRILSYDLSGDYKMEFPLFSGLNEKLRREQVLGAIYEDGSLIYVPAPMLGSVYCYDKLGALVKVVGRTGGGYGELAFPISVSTDIQGNVLVLDKHRHTVISFDSTGNVNGEIGGMGSGPGWFYHPIFLSTDSRNRIWVVQGFNNLVQVLQLPGEEEVAPAQMEKTVVVGQ